MKTQNNFCSQRSNKTLCNALKKIEQLANIGQWSLNITSNEFTFSDEIYNILRIQRRSDSILFNDFIDIIFHSDRKIALSAFKNSVDSNSLIQIEFRIVLPDGEIRVVEMHSDVLLENNIAIFGTIRDITDEERISTKYEKLKEKYDCLFKNAMHGIYSSTVEGKILSANSTFYKILGLPSGSENIPISLTKHGYVNLDRREELKTLFSEKDEAYGIESEWKKYDGKVITIRENIRALKSEIGKVIQYEGTIEDITEQIDNKKELVIAKEKAEKSENLKSIFLSQISHEIRTPINSLLNYAEMIKYSVDIKKNEDLQMCLLGINNSGNRMVRTVDLIVNMSEILNGSYTLQSEEVDLYSEVLTSCYMENNSAAKAKGLTLSLIKKTDFTLMKSDEYSLIQIFTHLINNAIKYTQNGSVTISIERDELSRIVVNVNDTGIGISEDFLPHIFKPFSQEEEGYTRSYEGNGLGLSLVKKYCELHKANIRIESKKDCGTNFRITFPHEQTNNLEIDFANRI